MGDIMDGEGEGGEEDGKGGGGGKEHTQRNPFYPAAATVAVTHVQRLVAARRSRRQSTRQRRVVMDVELKEMVHGIRNDRNRAIQARPTSRAPLVPALLPVHALQEAEL